MAIRNQDQKAQVNQAIGTADESANIGKAYKTFDPADQPQTFTGKKTVAEGALQSRAPGQYIRQVGQMYTDGTETVDGAAKRVLPALQ